LRKRGGEFCRSGRLTTCDTRISLLHLRGVPWARIAEFVGQRDLSVTADTYTHFLAEEKELDYEELLAA
jgi:hypothetical protein